MKPASFEYHSPGALKDAISAIARSASGGKLISGGQSLGPMLNLRLARPTRLVDVSGLGDVSRIVAENDRIRIGGAVVHARIEDGEGPEGMPAILPYVARGIAYRAVRNRGTVGGSLAHADPAADWITTMTVLGADVEATRQGRRGRLETRLIAMEHFMQGGYRTLLAPDEMITAVLVPRWNGAERWGYYKICRKVGEFADAIGAVVLDPDRAFARIVAGATGGPPLVLDELGAELARRAAPPPEPMLREALAAALPQAEEVKRHQLATAITRAIRKVLPE